MSKVIRICLLEDNVDDLFLLRRLCGNALHVAVTFGSVAEFEASFSSKNVDLIISDLSLPDMSGVVIVRQIQAHSPGTPIIVLTGHSEEQLALDCLHRGAQDFLVKGTFDSATLRRAARYAIERKSFERQTVDRFAGIIAAQSEIASTEMKINQVMQVICRRVQEITGAAGAVLEIPENDEMVYSAASGLGEEQIGLRLKIENSLSGLCVRTGEILQTPETETDPRVDRNACRKVGVRSMIVAPLIYDRRILGVLKILGKFPDAFSELDLQTLRLMAGLVAAEMHHARTFGELSGAH